MPKLAFLLIPEKCKVAEALPGTCQTNLQWEKWIWGEENIQLNPVSQMYWEKKKTYRERKKTYRKYWDYCDK